MAPFCHTFTVRSTRFHMTGPISQCGFSGPVDVQLADNAKCSYNAIMFCFPTNLPTYLR